MASDDADVELTPPPLSPMALGSPRLGSMVRLIGYGDGMRRRQRRSVENREFLSTTVKATEPYIPTTSLKDDLFPQFASARRASTIGMSAIPDASSPSSSGAWVRSPTRRRARSAEVQLQESHLEYSRDREESLRLKSRRPEDGTPTILTVPEWSAAKGGWSAGSPTRKNEARLVFASIDHPDSNERIRDPLRSEPYMSSRRQGLLRGPDTSWDGVTADVPQLNSDYASWDTIWSKLVILLKLLVARSKLQILTFMICFVAYPTVARYWRVLVACLVFCMICPAVASMVRNWLHFPITGVQAKTPDESQGWRNAVEIPRLRDRPEYCTPEQFLQPLSVAYRQSRTPLPGTYIEGVTRPEIGMHPGGSNAPSRETRIPVGRFADVGSRLRSGPGLFWTGFERPAEPPAPATRQYIDRTPEMGLRASEAVELAKVEGRVRAFVDSLVQRILLTAQDDTVLADILGQLGFHYVAEDPLTVFSALDLSDPTVIALSDRLLPPALLSLAAYPVENLGTFGSFWATTSAESIGELQRKQRTAELAIQAINLFRERQLLEQLVLVEGVPREDVVRRLRSWATGGVGRSFSPYRNSGDGSNSMPDGDIMHTLIFAWLSQRLPTVKAESPLFRSTVAVPISPLARRFPADSLGTLVGVIRIQKLRSLSGRDIVYRVSKPSTDLSIDHSYYEDGGPYVEFEWGKAGVFAAVAAFLLHLKRDCPEALAGKREFAQILGEE